MANVKIYKQSQQCPSVQHTFLVRIQEGCHNLYYQAFDGPLPGLAKSNSPIYALAYCSGIPPDPTYWFWSNTGGPYPPIAVGDFLLIPITRTVAQGNLPLAAVGATLTVIQPPTLQASNSFQTVPPYAYVSSFRLWVQIVLARITAPLPTFNQTVNAGVIRGVPITGNPVAWAFKTLPNTHYLPGPPSRWSGTVDVDAQPEEWTMLGETGVSGAGADTFTPDFRVNNAHVLPGQIPTYTISGNRSNNTDGQFNEALVRFAPATGTITAFQDLSKNWRKAPNPALP